MDLIKVSELKRRAHSAIADGQDATVDISGDDLLELLEEWDTTEFEEKIIKLEDRVEKLVNALDDARSSINAVL